MHMQAPEVWLQVFMGLTAKARSERVISKGIQFNAFAHVPPRADCRPGIVVEKCLRESVVCPRRPKQAGQQTSVLERPPARSDPSLTVSGYSTGHGIHRGRRNQASPDGTAGIQISCVATLILFHLAESVLTPVLAVACRPAATWLRSWRGGPSRAARPCRWRCAGAAPGGRRWRSGSRACSWS